MLNLYLCEDNNQQRNKLEKIIKSILLIEDFDINFTLSSGDPFEVIENVKNSAGTGIYFLDVDLKSSIDGLKLAQEIRKYDPRGFIIFITSHSEMSYLTFMFKVEALDFIIKDNYTNIKDRVHKCIIDVNMKYSSNSTKIQKVITIKVDDRLISLDMDEILFFETSEKIHKITVHCSDRQIEFYSKMKEVEELVDDRFYRCHRSYLVNKNRIKEIDLSNRIINMENGQICFISKRLMRGLKKDEIVS